MVIKLIIVNRIGRLYPAYKHPCVIELGGEDSGKVEDEGGRRS
ncbi:hypothetical protein [Vulcanisaeta sp. JCM 16159]